MRTATQSDIDLLVSLMAGFYAEAGYQLDRSHAAHAFQTLIGDPRLGYVWVLEKENQPVGHMVLTLRYGMEYGGIIGCLDDLYVESAHRNLGISSAALQSLQTFCAERGIRALTVEAGHDNAPAQRVYRRAGFEEAQDRRLLALPLAKPTHLT